MKQGINRRTFIQRLGGFSLATASLAWLAACSQPAASPTAAPQKPAAQPTQVPAKPTAAAATKPAEKPAATQAPAKPKTMDKVVLRLDWLTTGYHAPIYLGLNKGIFAENGIELTVQEGRGSIPTIQQVASGQEMFGQADATTLPKAIQQGAAVKMVAAYQQTNSSAVMFFKDSGIKVPKDLEGKKYGDVPGGAQSLLFPAFLKAAGVDKDKITVITTDAANKDRGFLQKQYEATLTQLNDSFIKLKAQADLGSFAYADYGVNVLSHGIIASNKSVQESPDIIRRFLKSWVRAIEVTREDLAAAAKITKQMQPDSPAENIQTEMLQEAFRRLRTKNTQDKPLGWMAEADWQQTVDMLLEYGALDQKIAPSQLFTNDFLPK